MRVEVAVVGAGPAGCAAAKKLAEAGFKVALVGTGSPPKACAGATCRPALEKLGVDESLADREAELVVIKFRGRAVELDTSRAGSMLLFRREILEVEAREAAVAAGATPIEERAKGVAGRRLRLQSGAELVFKLLIVAEGALSPIGRALGALTPRNFIVAYQERVKGEFDSPVISLDVSSSFYGWAFPKEGAVDVGVAEAGGGRLDVKVAKLKAELGLTGKVLSRGGALLPAALAKRPYGDFFACVGDAAGLVCPLTGEGIYYAARSGELAAEAAARALSGSSSARAALAEYWSAVSREVAFPFRLLRFLEGLYFSSNAGRAALLSLAPNVRLTRPLYEYVVEKTWEARPAYYAYAVARTAAALAASCLTTRLSRGARSGSL